MDEFEIEIKKDFLQEASELIETIEKSFLDLEINPGDMNLIDAIFRFAHSLKGSSRAVGFGEIAEITHTAENLLLEIKNNKIQINANIVSTLLEFNDCVREMVQLLKNDINATFTNNELVQKIENTISGKDLKLSQNLNEPPKAENNLFVEEKSVIDESNQESSDGSLAVVMELPRSKTSQSQKRDIRRDDETIRVSLNRLDKMNDLVGELVILKSLVEGILFKNGEHKTARSLGKLCKDIQEMSMSMRMVPVGPTFQKLSRVVRDTSNILNKKVELKLLGEDTEIDKTILENLSDPLVHIIRNAIDHGIETPEDRFGFGKEETGIVEIMAFHEGNNLVIQITDDGQGIDPQKLITKAKSKGIIPQNIDLSDQQGIELIFHPGFSTKEELSEVSGRGVGMDVVKTNIEAIGGQVKIHSKVGIGSSFRLILPLTLAIIDGMLVQSGGQSLIIPKSQISEVNKIQEHSITKMTGRVPYIQIREEVIPLFSLEQDLGSIDKKTNNIAIIISNGNQIFAVGVEDVIKQLQVVVKPPTKEISGREGIMGTTILGDGKPALIIDLVNLYQNKIKENLQKIAA